MTDNKRPTIDPFTRGYLEAALWTTDPYPSHGGEWLEHDAWTIDNIDPASLRQAIDDCRDFQEANAADLGRVADEHDASDERNGIDFFLTRCGHGAGFWDRGYGAPGDRLSDAANVYGSVDVTGPETNDQGEAEPETLEAWEAAPVICLS